jgi:hypothetical protein
MLNSRHLAIGAALVFSIVGLRAAQAQDRATPADNSGIFVTPVADAPFSAHVEEEMSRPLNDGTMFQRKSAALIARDSRGRIHNERHQLLPLTSSKQPPLLLIHIYDPETRLNAYVNPHTRTAHESILTSPPRTAPPSDWAQQGSANAASLSDVRLADLGTSVMEGIDVHGYRRTMTVSQKASGTGRPIEVTDEYWYSEELHINMLTKHSDPRTGDQVLKVTNVTRTEPLAELFEIPSGYKVMVVSATEIE